MTDQRRRRPVTTTFLLALLVLAGVPSSIARVHAQTPGVPKAQPPKTVTLYVFDCGVISPNRAGTERYKVTPEEVGETRFSVPCFLIAHPRGTLMWDLGIVPDPTIAARAQGREPMPTSTVVVATRTLKSQLAEIGYRPQDITYFAFSHAHTDHNANANEFAGATWLARPAERDFMYEPGNTRVNPAFYSELKPKNTKTVLLDKDEYDVFGDGRVVIKSAPGHSPGHQVLVLNLASTGRVMIAGDLYHYPQERTLKRPPPDTEFNVQQSAASRVMIEEYLKRTKTVVWIEHDFVSNAKLRKSPGFYE
jgi:glyoxylase-like metal-dependent hydrolase (beta-lactamase superfamily II)